MLVGVLLKFGISFVRQYARPLGFYFIHLAYIVSKRLTHVVHCHYSDCWLITLPVILRLPYSSVMEPSANLFWMAPEFSMSNYFRFSAAFVCDQYGIAMLTGIAMIKAMAITHMSIN